MKEATILNHLRTGLTKLGIESRRVEWTGHDGAPDLLIFARGGIWVETKAPGKKPRENQLLEHEKMRDAGMYVYVIDSIEKVDTLLELIKVNIRVKG